MRVQPDDTLHFILPAPPAATASNRVKGTHWSITYQARMKYRQEAQARIHTAMDVPKNGTWHFTRVAVTLLVSGGRMDLDNVAAGWKAIQDQLVVMDVLPEDAPKYVQQLHVLYQPTLRPKGMHVAIRELRDDE